jgi:hypothetical protein
VASPEPGGGYRDRGGGRGGRGGPKGRQRDPRPAWLLQRSSRKVRKRGYRYGLLLADNKWVAINAPTAQKVPAGLGSYFSPSPGARGPSIKVNLYLRCSMDRGANSLAPHPHPSNTAALDFIWARSILKWPPIVRWRGAPHLAVN